MTDPLDDAKTKIAAGDLQGAFLALRPALDYPGAIDDAAAARETLAVFAPIAEALGGPELGGHVRRAAANPDDADALYEAAYVLYEQRQFGLGATLLARANRASPGSAKIVTELSSCLEGLGANAAAALTIAASGLADHDPFCAYLLAFNSLCAGDLDEARGRIPQLKTIEERNLAFMTAALEGMLARADAIGGALPLEGLALTAWHAAINGSVLLHESPHGHHSPMHGRYAHVGDSPGLMREGLERLRDVLARAGRTPDHVVAPPDRGSSILGAAASKLLGVPRRPWSEAALDGALVVVWNLDAVGDGDALKALHPHRPGQVLFAHASCWTDPFPYAPDVTTMLYQSVTHPYLGGALRVDPQTKSVTPAAPDERTEGALADEILAAPITDPSAAAPELLDRLVDATASLSAGQALGLRRDAGRRLHLRRGSPVPSASFR